MMTNKDKLAQMDTEELAKFLCDTVMEMIANKVTLPDDGSTLSDCCRICPVKVICSRERNGFVAWLDKEAKG